MKTLTLTLTEEEALILHTLILRSRLEFSEYCRAQFFQSKDLDAYTDKLMALSEKMLNFDK